MNTNLPNSDKNLVRFIYRNPQAMRDFLVRYGVLLPERITRAILIQETFERLNDKDFVNGLNQMLAADDRENHSNIDPITIGFLVVSAVGLGVKAVQNQKKRRSDERAAEAQLYAKELEDYAKAQSDKAAALDDQVARAGEGYTSTLLEESTKRQKNAVYVVGAIGVVLLAVLFTQKIWSRG
jgi:hypothetical protein